MSDKNTSVWAAFLAAQQEFKTPKQSGTNPHFKSRYSTLGDIFAATLPALHRHGLVFVQVAVGDILISSVVHAETGEAIDSSLPLTIDANPQNFGSTLSYYKRYAAAAMFAVIDGMDDDSEAAVRPAETPTPQADPPPPTVTNGRNSARGRLHKEISQTFPPDTDGSHDQARHWAVEVYTKNKTPDDIRKSSRQLTDEECEVLADALKRNRAWWRDRYLKEDAA